MKLFIYTILVFITFPVFGHDIHLNGDITNNFYSGDLVEITETTETTDGIMAMTIAADQCHTNFASYEFQGCAGIARFHATSGSAFSLVKRFRDTDMMGSCTVATAFEGEGAYGCGLSWSF